MAEEGKINLSKLKKDFSDWQVGSDYEIIRQIGSGSYGQVVEAKRMSTGQKVAIKRMNNLFDDTVDCKRILREVTLLRLLEHYNIIDIIEIIQPVDYATFDHILVVTDYCQSDLKKLFKSPIHLELIHIATLTYNTLCAIKYLHSAEVLHRDLKPANILINEDCSVKVADFGLARSVEGIEGAHIYDQQNEEESQQTTEESLGIKSSGSSSDSSSGSSKKPKLTKTKKVNAKQVKRELTGHVVTRWYRAPELILLEKDYTAAIDVWSVGCIFGELLNMIKENAPTFLDRSPLFPGSSCFPLSPARANTVKKSGFPHHSSDQLNVIFSVIGTPSEDEFNFVTDEKAVEYLKSFSSKKRVDFKDLFPAATPECLDFLNKTIVFNPQQRMSVDEALAHPLFSKVRDKKRETVCAEPIVLDFEKEGDMDVPRLRELFVKEIKKYHKK